MRILFPEALAAFINEHQTLLILAGVSSAVTFVATLIAVPWLIVRLPADYFAHHRRHPLPWKRRHPVVRLTLLIIKNLFGIVFVVLGIIMLVLPGQGLLTIVVGIGLMNFPGKYRISRRLLEWPPLLRAINWLRHRHGKPPLELL